MKIATVKLEDMFSVTAVAENEDEGRRIEASVELFKMGKYGFALQGYECIEPLRKDDDDFDPDEVIDTIRPHMGDGVSFIMRLYVNDGGVNNEGYVNYLACRTDQVERVAREAGLQIN